MKRMIASATLVSLLTVCNWAAAQQQADPNQNPANGQPGGNNQNSQRFEQRQRGFSRQPGNQAMQDQGWAQRNDSALAACLIVGNQGEIEAAKIAEQHASNGDVKKFAQEMQRQHSQMLDTLKPFAGEWWQYLSSQQNARGNENQSQNQNQMAGMHDKPLNFVVLKQEIGQQCVASLRQELESKKGAEFDKCYMGQQIGAHMHMLDTLKVFKNYASPQLQQAIAQATDVTQKHLDHAKHIIHELEQNAKKS